MYQISTNLIFPTWKNFFYFFIEEFIKCLISTNLTKMYVRSIIKRSRKSTLSSVSIVQRYRMEQLKKQYYQISPEAALSDLQTSFDGLKKEDVPTREKIYGKNILT